MSDEIFTHPAGVTFDDRKIPTFNTKVQTAVSGAEVRVGMMQYPMWSFTFQYSFLRHDTINNELQALGGFFLRMRGMLDSFLYTDPSDYSVTDHTFGTGDGTTSTFQVGRSFGGFFEPIENINVLTNIKVNGVTQVLGTDYTVSATGVVTFAVSPSSSADITWTGTYYFRCRFTQDATEFNEFMQSLWELEELSFVGSLNNRVK